jgi:diguanylate cyclase (GGDEF)-like protein/PAS domain S-box-containing protein
VNRALCRLVGYDEADLVGRTFQQITHPDDLEADLDNIGRLLDGSLDHYTMEKRYLTSSGDTVWVHLAVSLAHDEQDRPAYFVAQIQDITAARAAQERLEHRALHDPLTGLPNRDLLMDRLSHALARSARGGTSTVVMFCDLDHFKTVNDTYGHEAGDLLLMAVADRLRETTRPGDTVARLGGDEFVVVAEGVRDVDSARALGDRVRRSLGQPVQLGTHIVRPCASLGVAVATAEDDARSVLREADAAMYRAKALGRGRLEVGSPGGRAEPPLAVVRQHPTAVTELDRKQA